VRLGRARLLSWRDDPAAEVLAVYPDAKADEAKAEERARHWAGEWERRFARTEVRR